MLIFLCATPVSGQDFQDKYLRSLEDGDTLQQRLILEDWERLEPENPELFASWFNYYFNTGFAEKGLEKIDEGISLYPDRLDMRIGKTYVYGHLKYWQGFGKEILRTLRHSTMNQNHWLWTGNEPIQDGKETMLNSFKDYQVQLFNTGVDSLILMMREIGLQVLSLYPDHLLSRSNVAVSYMLFEQYDRALVHLRKAEAIDPEEAIVQANMGYVYSRLADYPAAISCFEKVIRFGSRKEADSAREQIREIRKIIAEAAGEKDRPWHLLDPDYNGVPGISADRAQNLLQGRKADTVIVAIVDNGAALDHEDLRGTFWVNPGEVDGNGHDDDGNGYVDDIHGWNFLGNPDGRNLKMETTGLTRCYARYSAMFEGLEQDEPDSTLLDDFRIFQEVKAEYQVEVEEKQRMIQRYSRVLNIYNKNDSVLQKHLGKESFGKEDLEQIGEAPQEVLEARIFFLDMYRYNMDRQGLELSLNNFRRDLDTRLNPEFRNREEIVGDDPDDLLDSIYGNGQLNVRGPYHGTGVASIVGALHNDNEVSGVARHVKLMIIRILPNGDERDKDIALAIRYAVNNGADIINFSFGKKYSCHPEFLEQVLEDIREKDVLIVNGAGNDAMDVDRRILYPTGRLADGTRAPNWITVGASGPVEDSTLVASFSNYGSRSVDVFAPGVNIPSCALNNGYSRSSGTSSAAPVVAGIAAVLKSHYPFLTGAQLKEVILRSAYVPLTSRVLIPGSLEGSMTSFSDLSVSGGIANLYRAVLLVEKEYAILHN